MATADKKILVLGVGNILLKDEGVGVHSLKELESYNLPSNVRLHDGWVAGIDLLEVIQEADKLIVIDAVDAQAEPGAIFRFAPHQVETMVKGHKTSLHQIDLFETLKIAKFLDKCPETVIIGIQPKLIDWGLELTPEIRAVLPRVAEIVCQEIEMS
ncbi:HyaD/HybD family hydrogenase maturation endopeptidase [Thermincola potens]|uniref:Hydrogenase maturation protease n=1 Tax=Thermincola potens (strain JR) TaxID=635013 RepID=D5XCK7_THEPJ|nr:HyaD/HybD family hydrogenase maturation endopeptidase [Thermincola potens]ADG81633.1 hydrogenase maturation protease [Thermincola potens JR]